MRDVEFEHLQSLLEFMYAGEVNISQAELPTFLRTAESLQIRGLTDSQNSQHNEKVRAFSIIHFKFITRGKIRQIVLVRKIHETSIFQQKF